MTTIPPVLSAEEWDVDMREPKYRFGDTSLWTRDRDGTIACGNADLLPHGMPAERFGVAVVALINDALPDDSPHKITWEDVDGTRRALIEHGVDLSEDHWMSDDTRTLVTLLAKLSSMLRPRT